MRLLTNPSVDSTQKTFSKWDEFLKSAIKNLGFRDDIAENMYPYHKGIPMLDGTYQPIPETGRTFYELSWADKICQILGSCSLNSRRIPDRPLTVLMADAFIRTIAKLNLETIIFPEYNAILATWLTEQSGSTRTKIGTVTNLDDILNIHLAESSTLQNSLIDKLFDEFLQGSKLFLSAMNSQSSDNGNAQTGIISYQALKTIIDDNPIEVTQGSHLYIYNEILANKFDKFDDFFKTFKNILFAKTVKLDNDYGLNWYQRLDKFSEVYCQDYLVISLNPIDKLMLSTKQSFGSCMSIAKQNDLHGTQSHYAFGLPAMFPSPNVFLTFVTSGKHKNMYWEASEWEKAPDQRNKDLAYKYMKMNCRALTYCGTLEGSAKVTLENYKKQLEKLNSQKKDELIDLINRMKPDQERLFVGRQYAAGGEDYIWQEVIEFLMMLQGISTGMAYAHLISKIRTITEASATLSSMAYSSSPRQTTSSFFNKEYCRMGQMKDSYPICYDRYGFMRGFYYDNLSFTITDEARASIATISGKYVPVEDSSRSPVDSDVIITVGSSRSGSGGIAGSSSKRSELDMFKMMTGKQNYTYYQSAVKICRNCGQLIVAQKPALLDPHDPHSTICNDCIEKLELKRCEYCNRLYDKDHADEHEVFNINRFIHPKNWQKIEPKNICKTQLKMCQHNATDSQSYRGAYYLCAHCGKLQEAGYMSSHHRAALAHMTIFGIDNILVGICSKCLEHSTMCSRCRKLVFMDDLQDACLLLPNRRIVCPECISKIRMRQEQRDVLKDVLSKMQPVDVSENPAEELTPEQKLAKRHLDQNMYANYDQASLKDVVKQIKSYLQAHPEVHFPVVKESDPISREDDRIEVAEGQARLNDIAEALEQEIPY